MAKSSFLKRFEKKAPRKSIFKSLYETVEPLLSPIFNVSSKTMWYVGTVAVLVAIPIILEVEREQESIEFEKATMGELRHEGFADNQLKQFGFQPDQTPNVLTK